MRYSDSLPVTGSTENALKTVETILMPHSFRIVQSDAQRIELRGPGLKSSREDPIKGATWIQVEARGGQLVLDSRLGGVVRMSLFVIFFPIVLWLALGLAPVIKEGWDWSFFHTSSLVGMAIWLVLGPAMGAWIRHLTIESLKTMLANAART